ncbi:hypothetical protein [Caenibius sp. WL]|uniref:hypothetical protein n=1 Tax=Caenibius sp. WL TaxID=2872646 RepID=UPI001C9942DF|nr:hypothetical protein [Caenibius sp. WL]QZP09141.1 hypothetical protein K5X80_05065 [Caenibius sp. WL]
MTYIFDHTTDIETTLEELDVKFTCPNAGWVRLMIKPLHKTRGIDCSYVFDPFPEMIEWLEQIASGARTATWEIDEEGQTSHLQFYAAPQTFGKEPGNLLLHMQSSDGGILRIRGTRVDRRQLVESVYRTFRTMTADPAYLPREWEMHPQFHLLDDLDEEEEEYEREREKFPYTGHNLRQLTSVVVENYLAERADSDRQLTLFSQ